MFQIEQQGREGKVGSHEDALRHRLSPVTGSKWRKSLEIWALTTSSIKKMLWPETL